MSKSERFRRGRKRPPEGEEGMTPEHEEGISEEELEAERAGPLPDREALSVLGADVAIPADPSIAADVLAGEEPPDDVADAPEDAGHAPEDAGR